MFDPIRLEKEWNNLGLPRSTSLWIQRQSKYAPLLSTQCSYWHPTVVWVCTESSTIHSLHTWLHPHSFRQLHSGLYRHWWSSSQESWVCLQGRGGRSVTIRAWSKNKGSTGGLQEKPIWAQQGLFGEGLSKHVSNSDSASIARFALFIT